MNYRKVYDVLMARAIGRQLDEYSEQHHIVPRCMGGGNGANVVRLTYREHFLAHWLLTKFTTGSHQIKMRHALNRMTHRWDEKIIISGWQYRIARMAQRKAVTGSKINLGRIHSAETRAKMSAAIKMRWENSPEYRAKVSAFHKGKPKSDEHRARISASNKGKIFSPETLAKMSTAHRGNNYRKGKTHSVETRAKIGARRRGSNHSDEARAKISASVKIALSKIRKKLSEAQTGRTHSAETRAKMSAAAFKRKRNYVGQFESL